MASERLQLYKCDVCGLVVEVLTGGAGEVVCCGQPATLLVAKTADEGKEKHVPVVAPAERGIKVKVGSVAHPMEAKHYIEWIEVICDGGACRQFLNPGDAPEATFCCAEGDNVKVRESCTIHGVWEA